jgi:homocysteine S-methyltransferase
MEPKYRAALPHLTSPTPFLTEGGIETTLFFLKGIDLPSFASFPLLATPSGRAALRDAHAAYVPIALAHCTGIIFETPTWRASAPWIRNLEYPLSATEVNRDAVKLLREMREEFEVPTTPIMISGCLGPLQDAYRVADAVTVSSARDGYAEQVRALADAGVDMLSLMTTSCVAEAVAAAQLAAESKTPIMVSFSVETDGRLLGGMALEQAIREVDEATEGYVVYFGINCAHPVHFMGVLKLMGEEVRARIGCVRANASVRSHEELDGCEALDRGDPAGLAEYYKELRSLLPGLRVLGGCCGTDEEHVRAIASATYGNNL